MKLSFMFVVVVMASVACSNALAKAEKTQGETAKETVNRTDPIDIPWVPHIPSQNLQDAVENLKSGLEHVGLLDEKWKVALEGLRVGGSSPETKESLMKEITESIPEEELQADFQKMVNAVYGEGCTSKTRCWGLLKELNELLNRVVLTGPSDKSDEMSDNTTVHGIADDFTHSSEISAY